MSNSYLTHAIHHYHAKYIPKIPRYFINKYSNEYDLVLDPFCGSGTTLLEAKLLKRHSIGVDLSFLAAKISTAKTTSIDIEYFKKFHENFLQQYDTLNEFDVHEFPDKYVWYTKENNDVLDKLFTLIQRINNPILRNIYEVAFSSILKTTSNKRATWNNGYVADNVLPNQDYLGDVLLQFNRQISKYMKNYKELNIVFNDLKDIKTQVFNSDILDYKSEQLVDIVVTSPPYPFAVDFVKYNRLSYYWFGVNVIEMAEKETGSRHKRNRKQSTEDFFEEMEKIYKHIFSMVKKGGYFCMTVSDTHKNKKRIYFYDWLVNLFNNNGWSLVESNIRELESQSMAQKRISEEHMVVFTKNDN